MTLRRLYVLDGTMPPPHPGGPVPTLATLVVRAGGPLRVVPSQDGRLWYVRRADTGEVYARGLTEADALLWAFDVGPPA